MSEDDVISKLGIGAGVLKQFTHLPTGSLSLLHHVTFGSFTPNRRQGNKEPFYYFHEIEQYSINAVGLTNQGLGAFVSNDLPNIFTSIDGACELRVSLAPLQPGDLKAMLDEHGQALLKLVDEVEVNAACPNHRGDDGKLHEVLCCDPFALENLMAEAEGYQGQIAIKIAPDMSDEQLKQVVDLALKYGFTSIVSGNTRKSSSFIDGSNRLSVPYGGLAGSVLLGNGIEQVMNLRDLIDESSQGNLGLRLIACGGVMSAADYQAYLDAGADVVQIVTYYYQHPKNGISDLMTEFVTNS